MIEILESHPMQEYMDILNTSTSIYMDLLRLKDAYNSSVFRAVDLESLIGLTLQIESAGRFNYLSTDNLWYYLNEVVNDFEKRFRNKKVAGKSLDMKRVIEPMIAAGIEVELLTLYKEYRSHISYSGTLRGLIQENLLPTTSVTGRHIVTFPTNIGEQSNLRVYYKDIAVVSIPKIYSNMITGPSDAHYIAWCDYPQADWRFAYNLFIRDDENIKVMSACKDAYEGLARLVEGDSFSLEAFKQSRKQYKVHTLKVFYFSRDKAAVPSAIREYFKKSPKYAKLIQDCQILQKFGLPIPCTSYFGYEQMIPEASYEDAFVSKVTNTIIQTMTSEVVKETVMTILKKFWDLGYTKDDINVYYVRHDEPLFTFTKKILKDAWIFKECSEISLPGFSPIHLDFFFGQYYQEPDERLTQEINEAIDSYTGNYTTASDGVVKDYNPLPSVESCHIQMFFSGDRCEVVGFDYRTRRRLYWEGPKKESLEDQLIYAMEDSLVKELGNPSYLLVYCANLEFWDYVDEERTLMKVLNKLDNNVAVLTPEERFR